MPDNGENPRITIVVSGGMVQSVFTLLGAGVEVDILDFDNNGALSDDERKDLEIYLERIVLEQRKVY